MCLTPLAPFFFHPSITLRRKSDGLTAVKSNSGDARALAQIVEDTPVQVKRLCRQVDASFYSATFIVGASHVYDEEIGRREV